MDETRIYSRMSDEECRKIAATALRYGWLKPGSGIRRKTGRNLKTRNLVPAGPPVIEETSEAWLARMEAEALKRREELESAKTVGQPQ